MRKSKPQRLSGRAIDFEKQESIRHSLGIDTNLVRATVGGKKNVFLVEKIFPKGSQEFYCEHYSNISNLLRKLKLSVVPTVRVVKEDGKSRLFLTDLSREKKYGVTEYVNEFDQVIPVIHYLKNKAEIEEKIRNETKIAADNNIEITPRAWIIQVDPKTYIGKPVIFDLKWVGEI